MNKFGALEINPAVNPAILDTATWDAAAAWRAVEAVDDGGWQAVEQAIGAGNHLPVTGSLTPHTGSAAHCQGSAFLLAGLPDAQQVFVEISPGECQAVLGAPIGTKALASGGHVAVYKTDAAALDRFFRLVNPSKGPKAMGPAPRLGIGTRMTTLLWPGIWQAMAQGRFAANAIQNSVRELNLLDNLLGGRPPEVNYAFNFGAIETGYTGSTFEGLWVSGVLDALKSSHRPAYGADADHLQVKRGADGLARAKRLVDASRYYTFFTLDVSDVLNYTALSAQPASTAEGYLNDKIRDAVERRAVLDYHRQERRIGGATYRLDAAIIGQLVGKYWDALDAVQELTGHVQTLKDGQAFDLELSIDEHPAEVPTFDCLTTDAEVLFVIREMQRRGIPVTHVAPNFGVEKGVDYSCPDGLDGLEKRARSQSRICEELGVMVDFHSGDDLSAATRRVIRRATEGRSHFKISPSLQLLFAKVLQDHHPDLFRRWWADAEAYTQREAQAGSAFAAQCLHEYETSTNPVPDVHHSIFHHYSFAFVGRRDARGQFLHREEFYSLSGAFAVDYQNRAAQFLCGLAEELFDA